MANELSGLAEGAFGGCMVDGVDIRLWALSSTTTATTQRKKRCWGAIWRLPAHTYLPASVLRPQQMHQIPLVGGLHNPRSSRAPVGRSASGATARSNTAIGIARVESLACPRTQQVATSKQPTLINGHLKVTVVGN